MLIVVIAYLASQTQANMTMEGKNGVQASSIRISETRRRRARRQRQRAWAKSGAIAQKRTDRGWMEPSSGTTPNEKLIGRVSPITREDAPVRVSSPEFYTPSAELFLHPHDVDEVGEPNQVDRYLYLTNEFLKNLRGVISQIRYHL